MTEATKGWTHSFCWDCWWDEHPPPELSEEPQPLDWPVRMTKEHRDTEPCCRCGNAHRSGIYVRISPSEVPRCPGHAEE